MLKLFLDCVPLRQRPGTFQVDVSPWCILLKSIKFHLSQKKVVLDVVFAYVLCGTHKTSPLPLFSLTDIRPHPGIPHLLSSSSLSPFSMTPPSPSSSSTLPSFSHAASFPLTCMHDIVSYLLEHWAFATLNYYGNRVKSSQFISIATTWWSLVAMATTCVV